MHLGPAFLPRSLLSLLLTDSLLQYVLAFGSFVETLRLTLQWPSQHLPSGCA